MNECGNDATSREVGFSAISIFSAARSNELGQNTVSGDSLSR
jgi:hypothetical protein